MLLVKKTPKTLEKYVFNVGRYEKGWQILKSYKYSIPFYQMKIKLYNVTFGEFGNTLFYLSTKEYHK